MKYIIISIFIFIVSVVLPARINAEARDTNSSRSGENHEFENRSQNVVQHASNSAENVRHEQENNSDNSKKSDTEIVPEKTHSPAPQQNLKLGDANSDGKVDLIDFSNFWLVNYLKLIKGYAFGDFDNSGKIDGVDYVIWLNNFGK